MRVELTEPESVVEPRLGVEHQQVLALVLRPARLNGACDVPRCKGNRLRENRTTRFVAHIVVNGHHLQGHPRGGRQE
jgi:hypothetical protein